MKNSKRFARILSVMLCSILAATAISGCGKGGNESSTPASGSSTSTPASSGSSTKGSLYIEGSEGVTLTYWNLMLYLMAGGIIVYLIVRFLHD